jgi:hypothetical protein
MGSVPISLEESDTTASEPVSVDPESSEDEVEAGELLHAAAISSAAMRARAAAIFFMNTLSGEATTLGRLS